MGTTGAAMPFLSGTFGLRCHPHTEYRAVELSAGICTGYGNKTSELIKKDDRLPKRMLNPELLA
jgi:hypothetical protein